MFPTADELLNAELWSLGLALLIHIKSHAGFSSGVYQNGMASFSNLLVYQNHGGKQEYGDKQPQVDQALAEAWSWLQRDGLVVRDENQPYPWFRISRKGEEFLRQKGRFEQWEKLGVERVKGDLQSTGGIRDVGGPLEASEWAWKWLEMKGKANSAANSTAAVELTAISVQRIDELRALSSTTFDFRKLIRLCEEINISYASECYFATAMLSRALLDHVPPIFGMRSFSEAVNNYGGGGKSFKGTMQHLEDGLRNVADGHLHQQIRNKESVPTAQQVYFASALDVLLAEIVRIVG